MSFDILCNPFSVLRHVHPRAAGRIAYIAGFGGGGKSTPTDQTITQTTLPEEFRPYFERLMGRVEEQSAQGYQPYGGRRLAPMSDFADINKSQEMVRGVAGQGIQGLDAAQANAAANMARARELGDYKTGTFTGYGGFNAGKADPYAGFNAGKADPYAGFAASKADPYAGFTAGKADPYAGFAASKANPYAGFTAGKADPYAGFKATAATPYSDFKESGYTASAFGPAGEFTSAEASKYMNPYMQNVVDIEKRRADEDYNIARLGRSSRAASAGAFGGSRGAIQEGLAERDLLERQGGIQARGLSTAYTDAQGMFSADRAARMGVEQARAGEAGRVQAGIAGEAARVQQARAEELARTQGINVSEAARIQAGQAGELARTQGIGLDEAARVQAAQAGELARTQGIDVGEAARVQQASAAELARTQGIGLDEAARIQAAQAGELARTQGIDVGEAARVQQANAAELARTQGISIDEAARIQAGQAGELGRTQGINLGEAARVQQAQADELARTQTGTEASRQFGAGQGIAALDASRAAGTQLVGLGEKEREAQIQNAQLLDTIGREQRGEVQTGLDIGYQDFLRQQGYPEEQLAFFANALQGLPVQATGTTTSTGSTYTNPAQQAVGAGLAGLSLYKAYT